MTNEVRPPIETRALAKRFGAVRALDGMDLTVHAGEVHGFLGPNGAGKTTTLRILLGLIRRTGGEAYVLGCDPWLDYLRLHEHLAYVPGDVSLWPNLTGGEVIDLLTRLRGGADQQLKNRLISDFELNPKIKCRGYSKGNRQKVAVIAALARPVPLYLFDEPTSGLDPLMEQVFGREIARLRSEGATVLLSSHILSEVEELCDRVTIIRRGMTVETGTLAELRRLSRTTFRVVTSGDLSTLLNLPGVRTLPAEGETSVFEVDADKVAAVLPVLSTLPVTSLTVSPPSLEQLFLSQYTDAPEGREGELVAQ
jgi:polyether ionophore transport system ATP-binding protein